MTGLLSVVQFARTRATSQAQHSSGLDAKARTSPRAESPVGRGSTWLYRRPSRVPLVVGAVGFAVAATVTFAIGWPPAPVLQDEFSYLLASDTFAHGRLTNPTPPFWQHYESFHIIQVPTYASKYPPGSSLVMALGQILTGAPIVGVWIGYALMCAAIAWMLQAWTRPTWAFWGSLMVALWFAGRHADAGYWTSSYWGGAVAAAGSALVLGGVRRLTSRPIRQIVVSSAALGVGLVVLANTRPFEGFLFALPTIAYFLLWCIRLVRMGQGHLVSRSAAILVPALLSGAAFMAYYNWRVTGSATRFPYVEHARQYETVPLLLGIDRATNPSYRHDVMRCFYTVGEGHVDIPSSTQEFLRDFWSRSEPLRLGLAPFFVFPLFLALPWALRRDRLWLPAACALAVFAAWAVDPRKLLLHYAGPFVGAYCVLLTVAARRLNAFRVGGIRAGRRLVQAVAVFTLASALATVLLLARSRSLRFRDWEWHRAAMQASLASTAQRDLVIVEYGPRHEGDFEWVYNAADIEASPVVWARGMGPREDLKLLRHFPTRQAWRLRVDDDMGPFTLTRIDSTALAADSNRVVPPSHPPARPATTEAECRS